MLRLLPSTFGSIFPLTLESCPRFRMCRMKTENNSSQGVEGPGRARWIGVAVAIVAVVGLSYGALRFWSKPIEPAAAPMQAAAGVAGSPTESVVVPVEGMSCMACVARVKKTLKETAGVSEVNVSLEKNEAEIRYEPAKTSGEKLAKVIDEMGYKPGTPRLKEKAQ